MNSDGGNKMTTHDKVYVFVNVIRKEEKLICSYLENWGYPVKIFLPKDKLDLFKCTSRLPSRVLIRCLSSTLALERSRMFEAIGITTMNTSKAIEICSNKALQSLAFKRYNISHPKTAIAFSIDEIDSIGSQFKSGYVIKPVNGSWGRGIARICNKNCLEAWIAGRESLDPQNKEFPVLVQEYIEKPNFDIRVVVVGSQPIVAFKRVSESWKTNTHLGAKVEPITIDSSILRMTKKLCDVLGNGIYGIDLMEDKYTGEKYVCEVNANPEFANSSEIHGIDVAKKISEHVIANDSFKISVNY